MRHKQKSAWDGSLRKLQPSWLKKKSVDIRLEVWLKWYSTCLANIKFWIQTPVPAGHQWLTPVILASPEAETRRIEMWSQLKQIVREIPSEKYPTQTGLAEWLKWYSACLASPPAPPSSKKKKSVGTASLPFLPSFWACWLLLGHTAAMRERPRDPPGCWPGILSHQSNTIRYLLADFLLKKK
jgi:hypothetical protein